MRIGDRTLVAGQAHGLRAAFIGPDLAFLGERHFDVAGSPAEVAALADEVARAEVGDVLVLASSGRLAPTAGNHDGERASSEKLAAFERVLERLGARARPGTVTPESWALIARRGERGWVPLAEGYSTDSGVALAYLLSADRDSYAESPGDLVHVRAGGRVEVALAQELVHASERTSGVRLAPEATVHGQPFASLALVPLVRPDGTAEPARIAWKDVEIGAGSWLWTLTGLGDSAAPGSDGVVYQVWFDGELAGKERTVVPGARWQRAVFDLRRFAGRRGTLALVIEPRGDATGDLALWGWPQLLHGHESEGK